MGNPAIDENARAKRRITAVPAVRGGRRPACRSLPAGATAGGTPTGRTAGTAVILFSGPAPGAHGLDLVSITPVLPDSVFARRGICRYRSSMSRYLSRETEPYGKWKGIPIYLTTILTALLVAGFLGSAALAAAHSPWL